MELDPNARLEKQSLMVGREGGNFAPCKSFSLLLQFSGSCRSPSRQGCALVWKADVLVAGSFNDGLGYGGTRAETQITAQALAMLRTPGEFQLTRPGAEDCATICDHISLDFHAHRFVLRQQVGILDPNRRA